MWVHRDAGGKSLRNSQYRRLGMQRMETIHQPDILRDTFGDEPGYVQSKSFKHVTQKFSLVGFSHRLRISSSPCTMF